uniref:Uncharacterized protein n=1 Tax=Mastacembelus armatus TaxID=205130 RepID=A0A3Q3N944_9TELE
CLCQFSSSPCDSMWTVLSTVLSCLLTCVDGPLLEQTGVFVQLPAVTGCVLPGDGEHRLVLEDTKQNAEFAQSLKYEHRCSSNLFVQVWRRALKLRLCAGRAQTSSCADSVFLHCNLCAYILHLFTQFVSN